jgi:hypothetical protein
MSVTIQTILGNECIGDSLPKINSNFSELRDTAESLQATTTALSSTTLSLAESLQATTTALSSATLSLAESLHATTAALSSTTLSLGLIPTSAVANGTSASFAINGYTDNTPEKYLVFLDGVHQHPGTDYTITTNHVLFSVVPPAGVSISVLSIRLS